MKKIYFILIMGLLAFTPARIQTNTPQTLPFTQNWTTTTMITVDDDWSGVPGIVGYRGDAITGGIGVDPQTLLGEGTIVVDVIANQIDPNTQTTGGVAEFHITDPVVALQGSGTADAPNIIFYLNTTWFQNVTVNYNLRDIDGSADNAVQPVALQYRVGNTGNFTNVPAGFVADATTGPSLATLVTAVSAVLPAACDNQAEIQVRVITSNAAGSDEWVGIDDISITANVLPVTFLSFAGQKEGNVNKLRWSTVTESNNLGFEVQRSMDGINYTAIGFVNSLAPGGISTSELNYDYTDNNVTGSKQYYRLRQQDFDGRNKFSIIVLIKGDKSVTIMIDGLFPNPASTQVNVLIATPNKDKVTLLVTDIAGKIVAQKIMNVETGSNTIPVDISRLTNGTYMVKLVCSSNCEMAVGKFVKN